MGRIPFNDLVRRWVPTAGVGAASMLSPVFVHGVSWAAAGMLLTALGTAMRFTLSEVLQHARQLRQQSDQYAEAMLREGNQHTEVMLLLGKVNTSATFTVNVAEVAQRIRVAGPAAPLSAGEVTGQAGLASPADLRSGEGCTDRVQAVPPS